VSRKAGVRLSDEQRLDWLSLCTEIAGFSAHLSQRCRKIKPANAARGPLPIRP
jgi:hypothetical protein